jgi:hypothetical protein
MNNEPVAYIDPYDLERLPHYDCHIGSQQLKNGIPLYTHPVKEHFEDEPQAEELHEILQSNSHPVKEITDEEIEYIASQHLSAHAQFVGAGECHYEGEIDFARAILKKASEK